MTPLSLKKDNAADSPAVTLAAALWLAVIALGYAAAILPELLYQPLFNVDLLLPAYGLMIAGVLWRALGLGKTESARTKGEKEDSGGHAHAG